MIKKHYIYKQEKIRMLLIVCLSFGLSLFCIYNYKNSDNGMSILMTHLNSHQTELLFGVLSLIMVVSSCYFFYVIFSNWNKIKTVTLYDDYLVAPENIFSRDYITLKYNDISNVSVITLRKQYYLQIKFTNGMISVPRSSLAIDGEFEELSKMIMNIYNK